jgi:hypothetical protein
MTMLDLFNTFCPQPSFDVWREVVRAIDGQPPANPDVWAKVAGGRAPLTAPPSEVYAAVGRGAGKSQVAAIVAVAKALAYRRPRWFAQRPFVGLFGRDQRQADELMSYTRQLFEQPALRPLVAGDVAKRVISLKSGLRIEVLPADWRKVRSRGYVCAVIDEAAFLDVDENSAQQDVELLRALRPALGRLPGSLLVVISSKHARRGILYEASKLLGVEDPHTLYVEGSTLDFNATFDRATIERAFREDPVAAASEFGTAWRADIAGLVTPEAIAAVTSKGVVERPPVPGLTYRAFVDFAGGSGTDSAAAAIAHTEYHDGKTIEVLDCVVEVVPPFSPADVCAEFARVLARYGLHAAVSDKWASQFAAEAIARHGVHLDQSAPSKSDLYLLWLALVNSGLVLLLDDPKSARQATALERKAGGTVDHPPRGKDDRINAIVGALVCGRPDRTRQYRVSVIGGYDSRAADGWWADHFAKKQKALADLAAQRQADDKRKRAEQIVEALRLDLRSTATPLAPAEWAEVRRALAAELTEDEVEALLRELKGEAA